MMLKQTRRNFIALTAAVGAGIAGSSLLAACAPKAAPTPAPEAPKAPADAPAVKAPDQKIEIRYSERLEPHGDVMRYASRLYEEMNPHITVVNEPMGWGDTTTKTPTMVAAGTMQDVSFQHGMFHLPLLGKKGAWLDLTPLAERDNHDFSIYWEWSIDSLHMGPQDELVAMPMAVNAGENDLFWNVEMFQDFGIDEPHDQMTTQQMTEMFIALQAQLPENAFAMQYGESHLRMEVLTRSFGGHIISADRKSCGVNLPESKAAHKWIYDLLREYKVHPDRGEGVPQAFYSAMQATQFNAASNVFIGFGPAVEGAWTLGHSTWPRGDGYWGTLPATNGTVVYSKTQYPEECWGLAVLLSSYEVSVWGALSDARITPGAIKEAWFDDRVREVAPPYYTAARGWDTIPSGEFGPLPVPYNARRAEVNDHYNNEWGAVFFGDEPYTDAFFDKLQADIQEIMDKPLP
jgi:ABC-type glycerol-3-phosphate transport system substrate-binding protein